MSSKHSSRETKETLAEHRQRLKIHLWGQKDWDGAWWEVMCPWCNRPIARPDDAVMHEWLIKRSAIPVSLQKMAIMCEYNCLLVHFQCHADHGQTREFKVRCAKAQYARYGRENIVEWVGGLGLKQHIEISEESEE